MWPTAGAHGLPLAAGGELTEVLEQKERGCDCPLVQVGGVVGGRDVCVLGGGVGRGWGVPGRFCFFGLSWRES